MPRAAPRGSRSTSDLRHAPRGCDLLLESGRPDRTGACGLALYQPKNRGAAVRYDGRIRLCPRIPPEEAEGRDGACDRAPMPSARHVLEGRQSREADPPYNDGVRSLGALPVEGIAIRRRGPRQAKRPLVISPWRVASGHMPRMFENGKT